MGPNGAAEVHPDDRNSAQLRTMLEVASPIVQAAIEVIPNPEQIAYEKLQAARATNEHAEEHGCCSNVVQHLKRLGRTCKQHPWVPVIAFIAFGLMCGLGLWGVIAAADSDADNARSNARSSAQDAARAFEIQLKETFVPLTTMDILVRQTPDWDHWVSSFNSTAAELMTKVVNGSIWNIQIQPHGVNRIIYPMRTEDLGQVGAAPGTTALDILNDTLRRGPAINVIKSKDIGINGPFPLVQGFLGAFVRKPVFISNVGPEESFGAPISQGIERCLRCDIPGATPSPTIPGNCSVCYNAATKTRFWGFITILVNYDAVTVGQDARITTLMHKGYIYRLTRPPSAAGNTANCAADCVCGTACALSQCSCVIGKGGPDNRTSISDGVRVDVTVPNGVWDLEVEDAGGWYPRWKDGLIAGVVLLSVVLSLLLFLFMVAALQQRESLTAERAANLQLAQTTQVLIEEKERRDVLLLRQYDLIACLGRGDAHAVDDMSMGKGISKERIEHMRRQIRSSDDKGEKEMEATGADPIQTLELLGEGTFGKVYRGLWHGTLVAVKTMILPANMSGQEKREKMAVMEAAISSSLAHPNIVQTYTYSIRPVKEEAQPTATKTMPGGSSINAIAGAQNVAHGVGSNTLIPVGTTAKQKQEGVHSYEVRLVLEYCDAGCLREVLDQGAFLVPGGVNYLAVLDTAADIAKAMVHLHAVNVLHSDLKVRNVMLKSSTGDGRGVVAKVADFGLSVKIDHMETHMSGMYQGTLTHMAPEILLEGHMSKAVDVYAFGITLWELLTGGRPFEGLPRALLGHAVTREGRRPTWPANTPPRYAALGARCWEPDPALRPSFHEVLQELLRMRQEIGGDTPRLHIQVAPALNNATGTTAISSLTNLPVTLMKGSTGTALHAPGAGGTAASGYGRSISNTLEQSASEDSMHEEEEEEEEEGEEEEDEEEEEEEGEDVWNEGTEGGSMQAALQQQAYGAVTIGIAGHATARVRPAASLLPVVEKEEEKEG